MGRAHGWLAATVLALAGCEAWDGRPRTRREELDAETLRLLNEKDPTSRRPLAEARPPAARYTVHARARFVWIRPRPKDTEGWLGYVTLGQSLAVRGERATFVAGGGGACETWVPVEPKGWVCVGRDATLDRDDAVATTLRAYRGRVDTAWRFDYARSLGAPRYRTLPTLEDQLRREASHLRRVEQAKKAETPAAVRAIDRNLDGVELGLTGEPAPAAFSPAFTVLEGDDDVPFGSTVAYAYEFDHLERAFVLGSDHAIIPRSRLQKFPRSEFRGVELDERLALPLVFLRGGGRPRYVRAPDGAFSVAPEPLPAREAVALTGAEAVASGKRLVETRGGYWVHDADAILIPAPSRPPPKLGEDGRGTWVEVSTVGGWLIAYERARPVYATLISAGRGDLRKDGTMAPHSATPSGTFAVSSKLRTATMRSENRPGRVHAEVMFTQVFEGAFALHGAYWHDDFGDRKSAGCVNLSPIDSKWLFDWSEPRVPEGWHAVSSRGGDGATVVVIHP